MVANGRVLARPDELGGVNLVLRAPENPAGAMPGAVLLRIPLEADQLRPDLATSEAGVRVN